ncbi:electron transfer flavoprotein subunit alpha [Gordonibacter sp. An230]|uniref:electron transfer flavoprotein subunit alpha/FixB family protein n=1 Tax=Gordonibacter sp. An230 TaxID=1965592 RepID=UPI000B383B4C|nr:electron transfer flavoprotein subunit alpha/FixB family protein [Gordonibacter sp. An230]OUO90171.1 electron transfer flavoprotein subunit alpha [Gordonibacter sp. An230]
MSDKTIAVFADTAEAYEGLCSGARALGGDPIALWAGGEAEAKRIAAWGARVVYVGEIPEGALYEDCALAFQQVIEAERPALVLACASKRTQCVAGRLAVRLGAPVVSDASRMALDDDGVETARLVYGGAAERVERSRGMAIVLVGSGVFEIDEAPAPGAVERAEVSVEPGPIKVVERCKRQEETVDLGAAKVVVCVGRGIQNERNVDAARRFASRVGGEMACTRPIAEGEGWMARSRYLGVSGAVVRPDVYVGLGVSGQVQHTVGMAESQFVVAVNKDKSAPIMKQCDLGLVADLEKALPVLASL